MRVKKFRNLFTYKLVPRLENQRLSDLYITIVLWGLRGAQYRSPIMRETLHTDKSFQILLNQTEIRLYLPFSD